MNRLRQIIGMMNAGGPDDAGIFITAAGITDATQQSAIRQLVADLKSNSLWSKMVAIYPFVGAAASPHSYNLKDPTLYQITWHGTVTHNANGITPNGTTGYGDTGLNGNTNLSLNDFSCGVYSRTASTAVSAELGSSGSSSSYCEMYVRYTDNKMYCEMYSSPGISELSGTVTNSQGLFTGTRRGTNNATDLEIYRNATSIANGSAGTATGTIPNKNLYIGASNNISGAAEFSARNLAFAFYGKGLTDTDVSNLYTLVQTYQTTLSRQV
jgi:hypothetical protein